MKIAVIGAGSWGTALSSVLAANGEKPPGEMAQAAVDAVKEKLRKPDDITVLAVRFAAAGAAR